MVGNFVRSEILPQLNIPFRKLQAVGYGIRPYGLWDKNHCRASQINSEFRIPNSEFNHPSRDVKNLTARSMLSLELPQSASLPLLR